MKREVGVLVLALCGCGENTPPPVDTGAKVAVAAFFGGMTSGDPQRAYSVLDDDSRRRISVEQFEALAQANSRKVGYAVERVHIQSCEERGDEATAHIVLIGRAASHSRRYQDAITLRRREGRWGIVLPANFGRGAR